MVDRLNKQLKAWGHSMEATDGGGLGPVYQELLDGEEKYVRELEVIVEVCTAGVLECMCMGVCTWRVHVY